MPDRRMFAIPQRGPAQIDPNSVSIMDIGLHPVVNIVQINLMVRVVREQVGVLGSSDPVAVCRPVCFLEGVYIVIPVRA